MYHIDMYSDSETYSKFDKQIHFTIPSTYLFESIPYTIRSYTGRNGKRISSYHQSCSQTVYGQESFVIITIPGKQEGYQFESDCCYIDMKTYFENDAILDAVAMNGVFFNFKQDYGPIGYYKQYDMISTSHSIPTGFDPMTPLYEPYFRAITIKEGQLSIDPRSIHDVWNDRDQFSHIMVTGPILITNGKIVMTEDVIQKTHHDIPIFQCDKPTSEEKDEIVVMRNNKYVLSCDGAEPGGLFHAANTNPRSAIAISKDDTVHFICVTGRCSNYMGMDLVRLTECIKEKIPDVWMAISVDGGASSKCIQKHKGNIYVSQHQINSHRYYVGNIISYQKVSSDFIQKKQSK